jgi:tetratricopeptide (TPR) repeat protein
LGLRLITSWTGLWGWAGLWGERGACLEVRHWLAQLLEQYHENDTLRARALVVYGNILLITGELVQAQTSAQQGLELARWISDKHAEAFSLSSLGVAMVSRRDLKQGHLILQQSLVLYEDLGNKLGQATVLNWLSTDHNEAERSKAYLFESLRLYRELGHLSGVAMCLGDLAQITVETGGFSSPGPFLEDAYLSYRQLGNQVGEAWMLWLYGKIALSQYDYQQASTYFEKSVTLYEKVGVLWSSWPHVSLAYALLRQGDIVQAGKNFEICLQKFQKEDNVIGVIYTIEGLASLHVYQERPKHAAHLFAWADFRREELGDYRPSIEQIDVDKDMATCLAKMGEAAFSDAYEEGKKMSLEEAIAHALAENR